MKKKPVFIGGRVPQELRDRLLEMSTLLGVPYIDLIERALGVYLTQAEFTAKGVLERKVVPAAEAPAETI